MFRAFVNIFVSLFVPKSKRTQVKFRMLGSINHYKVKRRAKSVGTNLTCSGMNKVTVNRNTTIGNSVQLNGLTVYGSGELTLSDYVKIGAECIILTDNHDYEGDLIPIENDCIKKPVTIDTCVWIGVRSTILPGTHIGEGAIIQAGSVVHGEIPPYSIAGGNPAKVFMTRDIEHYKKLKAEKKFLQ